MTGRRRRFLVVCLAAFGLAACIKKADPIEADVEAIRHRMIPDGGRIVSAYPLRRGEGKARASWQVESGMRWDEYARWVTPRLAEFRVTARGPDGMRLTRQLEGDVYALTLRTGPPGEVPVVEVTFEATPF